MKTWITTGTVVLALLGAATSAMAQNGFRLTSALDAAGGREFGILAHDQKLNDSILVVRPSQLSFIEKSPRADFSVGYQPEFELFENHTDLDAVNHTGAAAFKLRITERVHFNATDDLLITQDPTRSIAGSLIILPRRSFKQNMAHAALNFGLSSRNTLSVSFDNVAASAPLSLTTSSSGGRIRNAGTASFARTFQRKQILTGTYSLLNGGAQFFGGAYEGELARDLTLHLSAGLLKDGGENYLMSGQLEKRLGAIWINGGYHRFLSIFGTSVQGGTPIGNDLILPRAISRTNTYQVFSTAVSGKLSRRLGIEVRAAITRSNSGTISHDINNRSGRFKLAYGLTDRLRVYSDFQFYTQTYNVFVGTSIDRRRYVAGLQFDVSPNPDRVSNYPAQTKATPR